MDAPISIVTVSYTHLNIARGKQTLLAHLLDPLRQIARILAGAGTDVHAKLAGDVCNRKK